MVETIQCICDHNIDVEQHRNMYEHKTSSVRMDTYYVCILLLLLSYHCLIIYVYITCVCIYIYADIRVRVSECAHGQSVYTFFVGNR